MISEKVNYLSFNSW